MGKKYPLLNQKEVEAILKRLKFSPKKQKRKHKSGSSHSQWEGYTGEQRRIVTVKKLKKGTELYGDTLMKYMINQSGLTKKEFYES